MSRYLNEANTKIILDAAGEYGTPFYLYDEKTLREKCRDALAMPNAFGLCVRYAMKANSGKALLEIIDSEGLHIDASSFYEAKRARMAGIALHKIMLTTQEVPSGGDRLEMESMILNGMKYNVCSLRQMYEIGEFAKKNKISLSVRLHPGVGAGETVTRNTGDKYSCFGVHLSDIDTLLEYAGKMGLSFTEVHVHIGSGGEPETWQDNIDRELSLVTEYFPDADTVSFGGGLREARMPDETAADIRELGKYAKKKVTEFFEETGRKLMTEIEPGTYIAANMGCVVTRVVDKKRTGEDGFNFVVTDGGMEMNARPLLYGSRHPFFVISQDGRLLSSEFDEAALNDMSELVVVGTCCESGDAQSLDEHGHIIPRKMSEPDIGDLLIIGGAGAYTSSMSPYNYNSHPQAAEVLLTKDAQARLIRKRQTLEQIICNEI